MTVLEALATLESAVLECKKRNVNTPEVKTALDLLDRYIWPKWVIPQFRHSVENEEQPLERREGQQQVLRATSPASVIQSANFLGCEQMHWRVNSMKHMT